MSTSYHDETGQPASRAEMLAIMHSLAATGHTSEYLRLKEEFDLIENESMVLISKKTLADILARMLESGALIPQSVHALLEAETVINSKDEEAKLHLYESLDSRTLATIVEDMIIRITNGYGDMSEDIKTVLTASNYDKEVVYAAVEKRGLSYEDRVDLVTKYAPQYFYLIANIEPERVFEENREDFLAALRGLANDRRTDQHNYQVSEFLRSFALEARTEEELWLAVNSVPYGMFGSSISGRIADNPLITKEQVLTMLERDIATSGRNYWHVRSHYTLMILDTLKMTLKKVPEYNDKIKPLQEPVPAELVKEMEDLQETIRKSGTSYDGEDLMDLEQSIQTRIDMYELNFLQLKKDIKAKRKQYGHTKADGVRTHANVRRLEARLFNAQQLLNQLDDFKSFRKSLLEANLDSAVVF